MAGKPPLSDETRARILQLHAEGMGRNAICRELGVSQGAVSALTRQAGVKFDRAAPAEAVEARRIDMADRRTRLEHKLLVEAERLVAELRKPTEYRQAVGGQDPQVMRWTMPQPVPADKLKLMQAASVALDRSLKLADVNAATSVEQGKSMLTELLAGLKIAHRERGATP